MSIKDLIHYVNTAYVYDEGVLDITIPSLEDVDTSEARNFGIGSIKFLLYSRISRYT